MRQLPSRLRRLDDALAHLPLEEPMLLSELDGFLSGVLLCPDPVMPGEWMRNVWGADDGGVAPFDDPVDVQWFADAVTARHDEIARDLARGKPRPLFDIDERNGDVVWEPWIDGFAEAMALRPDGWGRIAQGDDIAAADALARIATLVAVAREESDLDSIEINLLQDDAPADIAHAVLCLYRARPRGDDGGTATPIAADGGASAKPGRNDPCACGSGRKHKRCCG